jgi:FtsH-binding integral membrane protein
MLNLIYSGFTYIINIMSKHSTIFLLGVIVAMLPFLGFPSSYDRIILMIIGLAIAFFATLIRIDINRINKKLGLEQKVVRTPVFVDSNKAKPAL